MKFHGWTEADVTINGKPLNFAQVMTLRIAISGFITRLHDEVNALGDDDHGKAMRKSYLERAREIEAGLVKE